MSKAQKHQEHEHAWVEGRAEMDRMFGDLAFRRRQWMATALVAMACSIVLAIGNVTLVLTDRNVPWVVEVDALGDIRTAGLAGNVVIPDQAKISTIHRAVINIRQVSGDPQILESQHRTALAHLGQDAAAQFTSSLQMNADALTEMLADKEKRYVKGIQSILPFPGQPGMYYVTWTEEYVGQTSRTVSMEGYFQLKEGPIPTNESGILNPLGLYITQYSISTITEAQ